MSPTPPSSLDNLGSRPPKHLLLAQSLLADIRSGRYPVESLLPTEEALCAMFGVSRFTVRSAVRALQDRGYVRKQRPIGTRVIADRTEDQQTIRLTSIGDLVQLAEGGQQMITANTDIAADPTLASTIGCAVGQHWRHLEVLRWTSGSKEAPVMLSRLWIHPMYSGVAQGLDLNRASPVVIFVEQIGRQFGERPSDIQQTVSAFNLTGHLARALQVKSGTPALRIQRWFRNGAGELILYADGFYNGLLYKYQTTLHLNN